MKTSIIIVNYNAGKLLENCLSSVFKTNNEDYEDLVPTQLGFILTATKGEVRLALLPDQTHSFRTPEDDEINSYAYTEIRLMVLGSFLI